MYWVAAGCDVAHGLRRFARANYWADPYGGEECADEAKNEKDADLRAGQWVRIVDGTDKGKIGRLTTIGSGGVRTYRVAHPGGRVSWHPRHQLERAAEPCRKPHHTSIADKVVDEAEFPEGHSGGEKCHRCDKAPEQGKTHGKVHGRPTCYDCTPIVDGRRADDEDFDTWLNRQHRVAAMTIDHGISPGDLVRVTITAVVDRVSGNDVYLGSHSSAVKVGGKSTDVEVVKKAEDL